jgi:hypothetical protein
MKIGTGNELPDACFMWQASGKPFALTSSTMMTTKELPQQT